MPACLPGPPACCAARQLPPPPPHPTPPNHHHHHHTPHPPALVQVVEAVAEELQAQGLVKLVVDPVLVSTSGDALATTGWGQHALALAAAA